MMSSPSELRLAHVADLHLGSGYHLGDEDRGGVNSRLRDFRDAWVRSCEQMVAERVDLVLFAGDAFRDSKPTPTEQQAFRDGLDVLCNADITMVAIAGNHDLPRAPGRTHALQIFDGYRGCVNVIDRPRVIIHEVAGVGSGSLAIACLPWVQRSHLAAADPEFEHLTLDEQNRLIVDLSLAVLRKLGAEAETKAGPLGSVLLAHGAIGGSAVGAAGSTQFFREPVLPLSELRGLPHRYQAWGHLHRAQVLDGPTNWAGRIRYSGSIERTDFAEANEQKGWWLVTLDDDPTRDTFEWRSSSPRPFVDLELPDPTAWEAEVSALNGAIPGAIVRIRYEATPEVARSIDHAAIRRALYQGGALKVHGPLATLRHAVTERDSSLTEETDVWTGWVEWADRQGLAGTDRRRLDRLVYEALLEVKP
ncbi:MAG: exonuclease SbcCD subunit D [Actinobacteria bacterium]|nr:exonuclease SbcCD subunit D [Actinomycetota bacterium]